MIVMGLDTVLAFELELAERPKSTHSYKNRPKSGIVNKQRPQSRLSEKSRSGSRLSDNQSQMNEILRSGSRLSERSQMNEKLRPESRLSDTQSQLNEKLRPGSRLSDNHSRINETLRSESRLSDNQLRINEKLRPESRLSDNELTGSNISEHSLTGLQASQDSLTNVRQDGNILTGSKLSEKYEKGTSHIEHKEESVIPDSMSENESFWLETRLNECIEKPEYETKGQSSRPKSCTRPDSRLSDIFTREIKYTEKTRPKTGIERSRSNLYSKNRPKTSISSNRSGQQSSISLRSSQSIRKTKSETEKYSSQTVGQVQYEARGPLDGDSTGLLGASVGYMAAQPGSTWKMSDSQLGINNPTLGNVNTPRILELDINRMMIGQNTISAQIGSQGLSNDRLVNAANNNLRAYMTVNRPGPNSAGKADRPHSGSRQTTRPSSSPTNHSASTAKRVRLSDVEIPTVMSQSQPLPPIGADKPRSGSKGRLSPARIPIGSDLPESPPGSSLRHSPAGIDDTEVASPVN